MNENDSRLQGGTLRAAVKKAVELGLLVFDTAQDYGFAAGQKLIGSLCPEQVMISAKYTPVSGKYELGQVRRSLMKDLCDLDGIIQSYPGYWQKTTY